MLSRGIISKFVKVFLLLGFIHMAMGLDDMSSYYSVYKTAKFNYPIEKDIISNLKSATPDDIKSGGFIKFKVSLYFDESKLQAEMSVKEDVIRHIIILAVSGFEASALQTSSGKKELADFIVANVNAILTAGQIRGVAFGDFVIQS